MKVCLYEINKILSFIRFLIPPPPLKLFLSAFCGFPDRKSTISRILQFSQILTPIFAIFLDVGCVSRKQDSRCTRAVGHGRDLIS